MHLHGYLHRRQGGWDLSDLNTGASYSRFRAALGETAAKLAQRRNGLYLPGWLNIGTMLPPEGALSTCLQQSLPRIRICRLSLERENTAMAHDDDASKDWVQGLLKNSKPVQGSTSSLEPEDSPFSRRPGMRLYEEILAESLLGAAEREAQSLAPAWQQEEKAVLVCLPSFRSEWALSVVGERKAGYWVVLVQTHESLWSSTRFWYSTEGDPAIPSPPSVNTYRRELAADLGGGVCDIWNHVLSLTRYPQRPWYGCDGVIYHFTYARRGTNAIPERSGKTWSPAEDSVPGKIVGLSHALGDYAKDSANQDVFLKVIQDHIEWFQTHFDGEGDASSSRSSLP